MEKSTSKGSLHYFLLFKYKLFFDNRPGQAPSHDPYQILVMIIMKMFTKRFHYSFINQLIVYQLLNIKSTKPERL